MLEISKQQQARARELDNYMIDLSQKSKRLKDQSGHFFETNKIQKVELGQSISQANEVYDKQIQNLQQMEEKKNIMNKELRRLQNMIKDAEEKQKELDEKSLKAEQTLNELVTKPFSQLEIKKEIDGVLNDESIAVKALLNLNCRLIHDLRQKITEEKQRGELMKQEFDNQINQLTVIQVSKKPFKAQQKQNSIMERRILRIEKEIKNIQGEKKQIHDQIQKTKKELKDVIKERAKLEQSILQYMADYNTEYSSSLIEKIALTREEFQHVSKRLLKNKKKKSEILEYNFNLKKHERKLSEQEIQTKHDTLIIESELNKLKNENIEYNMNLDNQKFLEQEYLTELSDLQRRIAEVSADFELLAQSTKSYVEDQSFSPKYQESPLVHELQKKLAKYEKITMSILSEIQSKREHNNFLLSEIRTIQAKYNQERYYTEKLNSDYQHHTTDMKVQYLTRNSVHIETLKDRIQQKQQDLHKAINRINKKNDVLTRIEKINLVAGHDSTFVLEDHERVYDRSHLRHQRLYESTQKEEKSKEKFQKFQDFYKRISNEIFIEKNGNDITTYLHDWLHQLQNVCNDFRLFGI